MFAVMSRARRRLERTSGCDFRQWTVKTHCSRQRSEYLEINVLLIKSLMQTEEARPHRGSITDGRLDSCSATQNRINSQ